MRAARGRSPTIERQVVVLPLPDSPTSPSVSPSCSAKLTRSTALTTRVPPNVKKCVWRSVTCRTGVILDGGHLGAPRNPEARHGFAGACRAMGGMGGHLGAPHVHRFLN